MRDNSNSYYYIKSRASAVFQYIYRYVYKGTRRIEETSEFPFDDVIKRRFPFSYLIFNRYDLYDDSRDIIDNHSNTNVPQLIHGDSDDSDDSNASNDSDDDKEPSFKPRTI
jgi:hypothetical protein